MQVQPYLFFSGRCEEAMTFYGEALGAQVTYKMRFNEAPDQEGSAAMPQEWGEKIMHANVTMGENEVMMSDGMPGMPAQTFTGFSMSVTAKTLAEAQQRFDALSVGGQPMMPLQKTFWTEGFGMVQDKFGVPWMVNVVE